MKAYTTLIALILLVKLAQSQDTSRYCHTCEGNINTDPCSFFQKINETSALGTNETRCENIMESCYTSINNGIVRRGCIGDGYCDTHDCETCNYTFCNLWNKAELFCFQCNSLEGFATFDENCEHNPERVRSIPCHQEAYNYEDYGCFSLRGNETRDGVFKPYILRGCNSHILAPDSCYDEEDDSCILCAEDNCNIHDVSLSGKIYPATSIIILPLLLQTYKLYQ